MKTVEVVLFLDGWIKMPLGTEADIDKGDIVLDEDPAPPKGVQQPPSFRPMSIVAKRSPISATAEHLSGFVAGNKVAGNKGHIICQNWKNLTRF